MKKLLLLLLLSMSGWAARGQSECRYWFDQDQASIVSSTSANLSWTVPVDVDGLQAGFHTLYLQVRNGTNPWDAPMSYVFYKPKQAGGTDIYQCWFDQNYANSQTGIVGTGFTIDVSALLAGFHTVYIRISHGTEEQLQSFIFYKPIFPSGTATYQCWFDQNYVSPQSGTIGTGFSIDVSALQSGFHTMYTRIGENTKAQLQSFIFYKHRDGDCSSYTCWIDEDESSSVSGMLGNGNILLDVSGLDGGTHIVNIRLCSGDSTRVESYEFIAPDPPRSLPYCDDFESTEHLYMPDGWTTFNEGECTTHDHGRPRVYQGIGYEGSKELDFFSPCLQVAVLPPFAFDDIHNVRISCKAKSSNASGCYLRVGVMSAPTDLSTFVDVDTLRCESTEEWENITASLARYQGTGTAIAFYFVSDGAASGCIYIDNLCVEEVMPTPPIPFPDNIDSADCIVLSTGTTWGIETAQVASPEVISSTTPVVGDLDGDGQPEIVVLGKKTSGDYTSRIYILNGDGTTKRNIGTANIAEWNNIATGRIKWSDTTYKTIIVVMHGNKYFGAYDADQGNLLWISDVPFSPIRNESFPIPSIGIADFNNDGWSEVYSGSQIFDAATGRLLTAGSGNKGFCDRTWSINVIPYVTIAHDFTGDGNLELAAGNTIYRVIIHNRAGTASNMLFPIAQVANDDMKMEDGSQIPNNDGTTLAADINNDGSLDVIVATLNTSSQIMYLYAWDVATESIICTKKIPNTRKFGLPAIGNIDTDSLPEICFITGTYYDHNVGHNDKIHALKYNPSSATKEMSVMWQMSHSDNSGCTGLTIFDFNQDGLAEIVYRDTEQMRIINGSLRHHQTGEVLSEPYNMATFECLSATGLEYPVVADVDGDNEAEIVVTGRLPGETGKVKIFQSTTLPWSPARKVWNQYAYNVTNVNEDLTIPRYIFNNAHAFVGPDSVVRRPYNNYLQQSTTIDRFGRPFAAAADLVATSATALMDDDTVRIAIEYANQGDVDLQAPYGITLYKNEYRGVILHTDTINQTLTHSGNQAFSHSIAIPQSIICSLANNDSLVISFNDLGDGIAQHGGTHPECDTTNNTVALNLPSCESNCDSYAIANGTVTNSNVPINGNAGNKLQRTQTIYPAEMLTSLIGKRIDSLHYYVSSGSWSGGDWTVSMGVTRWGIVYAAFDNTTTLTEVYHGPLTADADGGMGIRLDSKFAYAGGNLLIQFVQNSRSNTSPCSFYGTSVYGGSRYATTTTGNIRNVFGTTIAFQPQITFHACADPSIDTAHIINGIALPYCENFDNNPTGEGNMALYWSGYNTFSWDVGRFPYVNGSVYHSYHNSLCMRSWTSNRCYAVFPHFAIDSIQQLNISFYVKREPTEGGMLIVGVLTDSTNINTFIPLDTFLVTQRNVWTPFNFSFRNYRGTAQRGAFLNVRVEGDAGNLFIDDFVATAWHGPTIETFGTGGARVTVADGNAPDYWIEYGEQGFSPGYDNSTLRHVTTTPYYISDLTPNTVYDFYAYPFIEGTTVLRGTCHNPIAVTIKNECVIHDTLEISAAPEEFPYHLNGEYYATPGIYSQTFNISNVCDSVLTIMLTAECQLSGDTIAFGCDTFDWYEHTDIIESTESLTHTIFTAGGCDSTVTLHLTIVPSKGKIIEGATQSLFSVNDNLQVHFSTGNLQFQASTGLWRFAENQYDRLGTGNNSISASNSGWIDLFAWGCSGWNSGAQYYQPWSTNSTNVYYQPGGDYENDLTGDFADADWAWHNPIVNGGNKAHVWRTLSSAEWQYLFNTRTTTTNLGTENARYARIRINNMFGIILFPDHYTHPAGIAVPLNINQPTGAYINNNYSLSDWAEMENAGAVFLPGTGLRVGTSVSFVSEGYYWTTTHHNAYEAVETVLRSDVTSFTAVTSRSKGLAVRPVTDANANYISVDSTVSACDQYSINGNIYSTSGIFPDTLVAISGCDSIIHLHLTIGYSNSAMETVTACNSFVWHGTEYTESTSSPTYTATNASGCDSVITLHLTINHCSTNTLTVCDSYFWHGSTLTASGTYITGTDTLVLTVNHSNTTTDIQNHCDTYTWIDGNTYTTSNSTAIHTLTNSAGCDSTVSLNLTIRNSANSTDIQNHCDSYTWIDGNTYTASNSTATHILPNAVGCDSTVSLNLIIRNSTNGIDIQNHCDSYTWIDGNTYTASNITATHTINNAAGCDSVVTLALTINHSNTGDTATTACDSFIWYGTEYTISATPTHLFTNVAGCDSTVTINLTINYSTTSDTLAALCDSFIWYGTEYTASASPTHTFTNAAGCDSTVTLNLTINYSNTGDTSVTVCDNFTWYGTEYTASASPTHTFTNVAGCDSVVTLNLTINNSSTGDTTATACDSLTWWNTNYTNSTDIPTHLFTNAAGCDSVVTLNLTVNYSNTGMETVTACNSYVWHGDTYTYSTNEPTHTSMNVVGCDSVTTLNLTIVPCSTTDINTCDTFTWRGSLYSASGQYYDGTDTLNLTISYSTTGDTLAIACDSFNWWNMNYTYSTNAPTHTLINSAGCDSTVTLNLTIKHSTTGDTAAIVCDSFTWYGTEYTSSTMPTHTFTNSAGCDSTVTLHLRVNHDNSGDTTAVECDSFSWFEHTEITESTETLTHTFTNVNGCDSTVTLHLTLNRSTSDDTTAVACDSLTWNDTKYIAGGDYIYSHTDANGCTQVDTLHLTVKYSSTSTEDTTVCNSFVWHGTEYIASTNTPTFTSTNAAGCDSVTSLHLTIIPCSTTDITTCDTFTWHGTLYSTSGQYYDGTDTLNLIINYSNTGDTTATACDSFKWYDTDYKASASPTHTFTNAAGCDSTVTLSLIIRNSTTGIDVQSHCDAYTWIDGNTYAATSSTATHILTNAAGCDSIITLNLTVRESTTSTDVQTACNSYTWIDGNTYTASNSTATHTLINAAGCDSVVTLSLTVNFPTHGTETATECDYLTWNGINYTASGDYTYSHTDANGCTQVDTLHLTVKYSSTGTEDTTVCNSFVWHGTEYIASTNTPTFTSTNAAGCDSVTSLHLTIIPCSTTEITTCDTFTWRGTLYSTSGQYYDGTDTLNLTINYSTIGDTIATACDGFIWYGTEYTASATPTKTFTNAAGCDSTVTLNLTINHTTTGDTVATACDGFIWYGIEYTASANPTKIFTNVAGCDSTVTLNLTVRESTTGTDVQTACDSYTWIDGKTYTASNSITTHTLTNAVGCDSTVTLHLNINYSSTGDTNATVCDSMVWHGLTLAGSGDTTWHSVNIVGCDSTVTLHLTINYSNTGTETVTACNSYVWHGTEYTVSTDTATYTTTNAVGCDSVTTLNLTVNHCGTTIITACDTYTWSLNCQTYTSSGTYIEGTDTLMLTINVSTTGNDPQTACDSYTWMDGNIYTASNSTATHTITNAAGCDSTVTLNLTINYSTSGDTTATACDSFMWWNTNYTSSTDTATHIFPLGNAVGCDSTVTLYLTINYSSTGDTTATTCDSFTWWNTNYTSSTDTATHIFPLGNVAGCDSTVTLHLTVNYSNTGDTTATACDSFTWWNTDYTNSTDTATHVYTNAVGCDSTVTLHLIVNYSSTGDTTATACDSFTWYDTDYTVSSTPTHTFINAAGCDSVVTLNLTVNYSTTGDTTATACDSFTWYGTEYTASGTPTHTFPLGNAVGCDSTVTLQLTINYSSTGDTTATACDSFIWWNTNYMSSTDTATHIFPLGNAVGCDSTVTLNLTVNYSNTGTDTQTACDSHTWIDGETYIVSNNTATYILTNVACCDSTVTLNLTVNYSSTGDTTVTACNSYVWHGTEYTESSDTATYTTNNAVGCDSVTTLHLQVWPTYDIHTYDTICDDSSRFFIDSNYFQTGIYLYTYLSVHACDSLQTLNLTVYPTYDLHIFDTIYDGDTYTFEQTLFDTTGSYPFLLQAVGGCDSLRTLHLQRNRRTYNDSTLCQNQMPLLWNGVNFSDRPHQGNVLTLTDSVHLSGLDGIDSLVVMTVTMYDTSATTEHIHACDSIRWQDGVNYTASTDTPYVILTNVAQCDSVVHLKLAVDYTRWFTDTHTVCDSLLWIDQQWYYADNSTAVDTIRTVADCDSIVTLNLTVHYSANTALRDTICHGQSYTWHGFVVRSASSHLTEDFTFTDTLSTIHGCDSVVGMIVTKMAQPQITLDYITNCRDSSYTVTATATAPLTPGGAPQPLPYTLWSSGPVDLSIDGQDHQSVITVTPQTTTEYILYADYRSTPFCPSSASIALNPVSVSHAQLKVTPEKLSYQVNDFTAYDLDPNSRYLRTWYVDWQPLPTDAHVIHHSADITRDSVILALAIDNGQCIDTAVKVIPVNKISITAPNIFTPGSNDANGLFIIVTQGVIDADLLIYNRDGLLVHRSSDIGQGWDGHNLSGSPCPQGNYVWKLEYTPMAQPTIRKVQVGSVLLIR